MMHKFARSVKCWLGIALVLTLLCAGALAEFDMGRTGSVSVRIHTAAGVNVEKARIGLYHVGEAKIDNSNLAFDLTADFAGSGVSLEDLSVSGVAEALDEWLDGHEIAPAAEAVTDKDGTAAFDGVEVGLYLVAQDGFDSKKKVYFSEIESFLVMVPMTNESGTAWVYEIDAQPKVNPLPTPKPTPKPTASPEDETLPQTGMLRWPIPVLGVGGVVLFSIGWVLMFGRKKSNKDA